MVAKSLVNHVFGPYVLRQVIGGGATAEVWRAEHHCDHRPVAVKILREELLRDRFHQRNFLKEQELLGEISHPGIPRLRHQGDLQGRPAFAMDFIPGASLAEVIKQPGLPRQRALLELCDVVGYLHEQDVVHNDLKLDNVLWRSAGGLVLIDYGSIRRVGTMREITSMILREPVRVFNTPTYIAPELIAGKKATKASDCYALGVCAFILLSGQPPYLDKNQSGKLRAHATAQPPSILERIKGFPPNQARTIDGCLAKDPADRPVIAELITAVRSLAR
jgi:serine/threonine-protein kinase